jgi:hypothetical protein
MQRQVVRISPSLKEGLVRVKTKLGMPTRYKEGDVIQALLMMVENNFQEKEIN